jgi:hypothetical protein
VATCRLRPERLRDVADWIGEYRRLWRRASILDEYLRELQQTEQSDDSGTD